MVIRFVIKLLLINCTKTTNDIVQEFFARPISLTIYNDIIGRLVHIEMTRYSGVTHDV